MPDHLTGAAYLNCSKLEVLLGAELLDQVKGKRVVDFGCGEGREVIELAKRGAASVLGVEIREALREEARRNAVAAGVADRCEFASAGIGLADVVVSLDSFEHFAEPEAVLDQIAGLLVRGGRMFIAFGPPWRHPWGGHAFSPFPWAHLLFSERALVRWRADFVQNGVTRFCEVPGGLNQMTVGRFERMVRRSQFRVDLSKAVPIRRLAWAHCRLTREFTTSVVRCVLTKT